MTDREKYLLICLSEECAETIQAISKSLRFGLGSVSPYKETNNLENLIQELNDVTGVIELLSEEKLLPVNCLDQGKINKKKKKVDTFFQLYQKDKNET